uniref:Zinc finger protein 62 n=1 Tax=Lygus hesperus TaxID=30085 RepID=A0A146LVF8_LYGHE
MPEDLDITVLPPPLFNYDADDLLGEWKQWFQKLEEYLIAYDQAHSPDEDKIRVLLNHLGNEGKEIYESLEAKNNPGERITSFEELTSALAVYFESAKNVLFERFKFFKMKRKSGQPVVEFVSDLTKAASCCEFTEEDNIIRDKLLEQLKDKSLIERLLVEGGSLKLERAIKICQKWESRKGQGNENKPPGSGNDDPEPPKTTMSTRSSKKRDTKPIVKQTEIPVVTILGVVPELMNVGPKPSQDAKNIWDNGDTEDNYDSRDFSDSREYSDKEDPQPRKKGPQMCDVCGKIYDRPCTLKRHMLVHSDTKAYKCSKCDYRAAQKSSLTSHERVHEGRKFACDMCDFKARRSYGLKMHKLTNHSTERPFKCEHCSRGFPDVGALNYHNKVRHSSSTEGAGKTVKLDETQYKYTCDICGRKFISEFRYRTHIEGHKGQTYQCYACNFKTVSRNSIIRHLAQQHGSQTFTCNVCGFTTKCRRTLHCHKRIHGTFPTEKACDVCGYTTKFRHKLQKHKRIHGQFRITHSNHLVVRTWGSRLAM